MAAASGATGRSHVSARCAARRRAAAAAAVLTAVLLLAACSGTPLTRHRVSRDPLLNELAHVHDTARTRDWVQYGDLAAQRRAARGVRVGGRFAALAGYGWSTAPGGTADPAVSRARTRGFGFDPRQADQAVQTGQPPDRGGRLDGAVIRRRVVDARLAALGGRRVAGGGTGSAPVWRLLADNRPPRSGPLAAATGGRPDHDVVHAGHGVFVHAANARAAIAVDGGDNRPSLAENAKFRQAAACLAHPLVADLSDRGTSRRHRADGYALAVGVRGRRAAELTDVLCRTTRSPRDAARLAAALRQRLLHGRSHAGTPWRRLLAGVRATVLDDSAHTVRVTARPRRAAPADVFDRALVDGDIGPLVADPPGTGHG